MLSFRDLSHWNFAKRVLTSRPKHYDEIQLPGKLLSTNFELTAYYHNKIYLSRQPRVITDFIDKIDEDEIVLAISEPYFFTKNFDSVYPHYTSLERTSLGSCFKFVTILHENKIKTVELFSFTDTELITFDTFVAFHKLC